MIPNPDYQAPFPRNRTFFVILLIYETGRSEVFDKLFHTSEQAQEVAAGLQRKFKIETYRIYPVMAPRPDYKGENLWY